jgi:hypothetical protein
MKIRALLPLAVAMLFLTIPCPSDARGGGMGGHGGAFFGHGGVSLGHGGAIVGHGGVFSGSGTVIIPARPFVHGPVARAPRENRPFDGTFGSPFPFVPAVPVDSAPTIEINVPPAVVVPDVEVAPAPPPPPAVASQPARRPPLAAGPKTIVPPPPLPPTAACVHTVTVYRGSAMEVQSFPIPDCTATSSAKKPAPRG